MAPAIENTETGMAAKIERMRPEFLWNKPHFTNLVTSEGGKTIHMSGLMAGTTEGDLVAPGDLGGQMAYIYDTIRQSLALVGAAPADRQYSEETWPWHPALHLTAHQAVPDHSLHHARRSSSYLPAHHQ